jgi:fructokinase
VKQRKRNIDILCVGEVLIDFIGHQLDVDIYKTADYHRYVGGSPANVALNSARLGLKTMMVASVGADGFGDYILDKLKEGGVLVDCVTKMNQNNTSIIFVSKTAGTPEFIPYRDADFKIYKKQLPREVIGNARIFHTTCFALSRNPAQQTILKKAEDAFNQGCKLSIDVNYSNKIWDSREEAFKVIKAYCKFNPLVKISGDDMFRLFEKHLPHEEIFNFFHLEGADTVCLTLGGEGVKLSQKAKKVIALPAVKVDKVLDATGAGDAFWSGYLWAYTKNKPAEKCLEIAQQLAALKLQNVGGLPVNITELSDNLS